MWSRICRAKRRKRRLSCDFGETNARHRVRKGAIVPMIAADAKPSAKRKVASLAFWSIIIAFLRMGLKFVAWRMTGSVALYSDALESIVNVIAASAAFWAIRVSHKPADPEHPFGHHKAEYFSAVLEGVLIGIAAVLIMMEVARHWASPPAL